MLELTERDKARVINGIPESNLVLYCPGLQGHGASLLDRSVTGANGTITGAAWKHHPSGLYVLSYDGVGEGVVFGDTTTFKFLHGALNTAAFQVTIEFWLQLPTTDPDALYGLLETTAGSSGNVGLELYFDDRAAATRSDKLVFAIFRGVAGQPVISLLSANDVYPNDTLSHHIAVTHDQSLASANGIIYVDGVSVATGNKTGNVPSTASSTYALHMGSLGDNSFPLPGRMSLPRIYDRVLTPTEILRHATRERPLVRP